MNKKYDITEIEKYDVPRIEINKPPMNKKLMLKPIDKPIDKKNYKKIISKYAPDRVADKNAQQREEEYLQAIKARNKAVSDDTEIGL